ncbi:MAG: MFS transporter, partial [Pirellulales bacterium]
MSNPSPSPPLPPHGDTNDAGPPGLASRIRWLIFALSCATSWVLYLHRYTWNFIGPALREEYNYTVDDTAWMATAFNTAYGIGQIPGGILCDMLGAHYLLAALILAWSLSLGVLGLASPAWMLWKQQVALRIPWLSINFSLAVPPFLWGQRFVMGLSQAGCYPTLSKVSQVWFPARIRTFLQGWVASFFGRAGGAMSPFLFATVLIGWCGLHWQSALVVLSAVGVALAVLFLWLFRNSPQEDKRVNDAERAIIDQGRLPVATGKHAVPWRRLLTDRNVLMIVVMQFLAAGADSFYSIYLGEYFLNAKGLNIALAGGLATLPLWGGAFGGMLGGFLNDMLIRAVGRRWARSIVGGTCPVLAAALLVAVISQQSAVGAALALFAVKFFFDMGQPTVWGACTDIAGKYTAPVF